MLKKLSAVQISEISKELSGNDLTKLRLFYEDAIRFHSSDKDELHRRRMIIGGTNLQVDDTFYGYAMLSAFLDDRRGWNLAIEELGAQQDPGFSYLVYSHICHYLGETKLPAKWKFALHEAASRGHLPAKYELMRQKREQAGLFRRVLMAPQRWALAFRFVLLHFFNPQDRRLATYRSKDS